MPDRKPDKVYPYCENTVHGPCSAVNQASWCDLQRQTADKDYQEGRISGEEWARILKEADEQEAKIIYCSVCPLRI